jgi:hypothetical protein
LLTYHEAFWGLPGYTFQGIAKEIQKHLGSSVQSYIIAARTAQGYEDWNASGEEERLDIISRWQHTQTELKNSKKKLMTFDERIRKAEEKFGEWKRSGKKPGDDKKPAERKRKGNKDAYKPDFYELADREQPDSNRARTFPFTRSRSEDAQFEHAINASVSATSRGDPEEDRLIERAIRASVAELQSARELQLSEQEAIERAIRASISEAGRDAKEKNSLEHHDPAQGRFTNREALEKSLQRSLQDYSLASPGLVMDPAGIDADNTILRQASEHSKREGTVAGWPRGRPRGEDEDLRKAIEESEKTHRQYEEDRARAMMEEEIVLKYVEQQSLEEDQHRKVQDPVKGDASAEFIQR